MSENALVTSLAVNTAGAIAPLKQLEGQAKDSDASLAAMANSAATALEEIGEKGGRAYQRLAEGGTVSKAAFDGLARSADDLRQEVLERFGAIEKAPEEFQNAIRVAEQSVRDLSAEMARSAKETAALREEFTAAEKALEALNEEQARAAKLLADVNDKYSETQKEIDEIRTSSEKTFTDQRKLLEKIQEELKQQETQYKKLGTEGAPALLRIRQEAERVDTALKQLGDEAETSSGKLRDGAIRADKAFEDFTRTLAENPKEALEQFPKVAAAVIQYRQEIERARDAGGPVDQAAIDRLKQFETRLDSAKQEAGQFKREIDKATAGVTDASGAWQGFDSVINNIAGRFGKLGLAVVGGFAALKEGLGIGNQVAEAIGTDFSTMEKAAGNFKSTLASVTAALTTDGLSAAWLQLRAGFKNFGDDLLSSGHAMDGFNALVKMGVDRAVALKVAQNDLVTISQSYELAVKGGTEALQLFQATINSVDPAHMGEAIANLQKRLEELVVKTTKTTEAEKARKAALDATIASIKAEIAAIEAGKIARQTGLAELELEILRRKALLDATRANAQAEELAKDVKGGLSETMAEELENIGKLLPAYQQNRVAVQNYTAALEADINLYRSGLTPEREKELRNLVEMLKSYGDLDLTKKGAVQRMIEEAQRMHELAGATAAHGEAVRIVDGRITNVSESAGKADVKLDTLSQRISNTSDAAVRLAPQLKLVADALTAMDAASVKLGEKKGTFTDFGDSVAKSQTQIINYRGELEALEKTLIRLGEVAEQTAKKVAGVGAEESTPGPDTKLPSGLKDALKGVN